MPISLVHPPGRVWHMIIRSPFIPWVAVLVTLAASAGRADPALAASAGRADPALPEESTSTATGMSFVLVPAGEFEMGSPPGERGRQPDETPRRITITRPFYLGVHEVTQDEYAEVMERNPSSFAATGEGRERVAGRETGRHPVERISCFDAIEFCNRLGARDGYAPAYRLDDVGRREDGSIERADVVVLGGDGYRLPTEAEWEYACRAGTTTPFHYGDLTGRKDANCQPSMEAGMYGEQKPWQDLARTAAVGSYPANAWGLHDMHGNVAEWCWEWSGERPAAALPGPRGGDHELARGGSWLTNELRCRAASRFFRVPGERSYETGFRVARTPSP